MGLPEMHFLPMPQAGSHSVRRWNTEITSADPGAPPALADGSGWPGIDDDTTSSRHPPTVPDISKGPEMQAGLPAP